MKTAYKIVAGLIILGLISYPVIRMLRNRQWLFPDTFGHH